MAGGKERSPYSFNLVNLPKDLVLNISRRLTLKVVLRLKFVCKAWWVFFTDPVFARNLLNISVPTKSPHALLMTKNPPYLFAATCLTNKPSGIGPRVIDFNFKIDAMKPCEVWGSCDGLVCLTANGNSVIIWNPLTREYKEFAVPENEFCLHGFGYSSVDDDFKIVRIPYHTNSSSFSPVKIATLKTMTWRLVSSIFVDIVGKSRQVLVNGALHWLAQMPCEGSETIILCFNLELEKFEEMSLPRGEETKISYLMNFRGCLACLGAPSVSNEVDIWVMKKYGVEESWMRIYTFPRIPRDCKGNDANFEIVPVDFSPEGVLLIKITPFYAASGSFREIDRRTYVAYDLEQWRWKMIALSGIKQWSHETSYFESLISPLQPGRKKKYANTIGDQ